MIALVEVSYHIQDRTLLDKVSLTIPSGRRIGLIGRNGTGKTTLFRLLLGEIQPTLGVIEKPKNLRIATVPQEAPSGPETAINFLMQSDQERHTLLTELENNPDPQRMSDIYDRLIAMDAFNIEGRAAKLLNGLGFDHEAQQRPLDSFSGGFRMRIALASALLQQPDLLLLDEPTNHLDLEATLWLLDFLKSYPETLIVISHDRELLNACSQEIFHLHGKKITRFRGNYDTFEQTFARQSLSTEAYNAKVAAQKKHWQSFVDRFRAQPSKSSQAQSRIKAIAKLETVPILQDERSITLAFPASDELSSPFIAYEKISLGYGEGDNTRIILKNLTGRIDSDDRIALLGMNGNGKSTFAKFLADRLKSLSGTVIRHPKLRIGYFNQHQMEELDVQETAYRHIRSFLPKMNETQIRSYLGRFGFSGARADLTIGNLSGGERVRLVFSQICTHNPHLLILDEPTNHLDMDIKQSLIQGINDFEGAVVMVSHDWHVLTHTVDRLWIVANQTIKTFDGTLEDYRKLMARGGL